MIDVMKSWGEFLRLEKGLKDRSLDEYDRYINLVGERVGDLLKVEDHHTINEAIMALSREREYGPSTRKKVATVIAVFYKWALREGLIKHNPYPFHGFRGAPSPEPEYIEESEVAPILNNPRYTIQDIAMLRLLWDCGLRAGEMAGLNINDVDLESRVVHVRAEIAKGSKPRWVPFTQKTGTLLAQYIEALKAHYDGEILFPSKHWGRMDNGGLSKHIKRLGELESPKLGHVRLYPHKFRHSLPIRLLNAGMDLVAIQRLMGHSNIRETSHYTHFSKENLRKNYDQFAKEA